MSRTSPPSEAVLIRRAREAVGISPETAAQQIRIKMSPRRWRQLEAGEEGPKGPPAVMSNAQLAHMASVVRLRPEHLEEIGKDEAAAILRVIDDLRDDDLIEPEDDDGLQALIDQARRERAEGDPTLYKMLLRLQGATAEPQRKPGSRDDEASGGTQQVS